MAVNMPRLLISAAHKSSGKTTLSIGLCAALHGRGLVVQPYKKGPDFIDPMWLSLACERPCHNLDFYLMTHAEMHVTFTTHARLTDISLIEGNKGLYDGLDLDGSNSNAALATLLQAPVILVVDARGMTRGIAPLILGYQAFDRNIRIVGVILNQLGGSRHESKLRAVIEHYTDVPVLGAVHHDARMAIVERHLGLMPSNEASEARTKIATIARLVTEQVDLDRVATMARQAPMLPAVSATHADSALTQSVPAGASEKHMRPFADADIQRTSATAPSHFPRRVETIIKIGIARDAAFAFYYPGDLDALRAHGAELIPFDTLHDARLPDVDALFIGGGFPEDHMHALEANVDLRTDIRRVIDAGMPVYAECGGLMYLTRSLSWQGECCAMVGALPADTVMHAKPQGRGYVRLRETAQYPWPHSDTDTHEIRAHEFHYSRLENIAPGLEYAYEVIRGAGIDGRHDGIVYKNVLACYAHMRDLAGNHWARRFIEYIRQKRQIGTIGIRTTPAATRKH